MVGDRELLYCALSNLIFSKISIIRKLNKSFEDLDLFFSLSQKETDDFVAEKGFYNRLYSKDFLESINRDLRWYKEKGVVLLDHKSELYPMYLKECPDAPILLYFKGNADMAIDKIVSIVGTRIPTGSGMFSCRQVVENFIKEGYNPLIVSGLARGIDMTSHLVAVENNLPTVAILPCGIDQIYPSSNRGLAIRMIENGGVLTEFPKGVKPLRYNFLQRNRIIAGIARALVVVESRIKGGSMSTVEYALSYSREIFAIPGRVDDINSYGCNYLIHKNIAQIYLDSSTIPVALGWTLWERGGSSNELKLNSSKESKAKILLILSSNKGLSLEEIVLKSNLDFDEVSISLLELELEFKVVRDSITNSYSLAKDIEL